jgi:hypothetical protein
MNEYLVEGTISKAGTPETFQIEKEAASSRNAYIQVRDALLNDGCETVNVVAIKMKMHDGLYRLVVDPNLYLH